jgi:hypothetical protein
MSEFELLLRHLKQPEYVHVLLNPLPVYATAMGIITLVVAFFLKSKRAQLVALLVIFIGGASAWPVRYYGKRGYDRVYSMSYGDAQKWLELHAARADKFIFVFYITAILAVATAISLWKFPKIAQILVVATLLSAILAYGIGAWISHAGGQVRHSEFRNGPPP